MTLTSAIIIALVSLIFSALFSGSEIAFISADRVSVEIDIKRGGILSRLIEKFYDNSSLFITTILVGNNIMLVVYGMGAAYLLKLWFIDQWQVSEVVKLVTEALISTGVVLLIGEFFPKATFRINPYKSLRLIALPLYTFYILFWPISKATTWLSKRLMKLLRLKSDDEQLDLISVDELNRYLENNIDRQPIGKHVGSEVQYFHNAIDFNAKRLRDCLIPRNEIIAVNIDTTTAESLSDLFTSTGRSKIIVYREDIDDIVGYIHVSELFFRGRDWRKQLKSVIFVPETYPAKKMMQRLLAEKRSIAIVVDEFGGTAGLVTLEDLVEEIFGNIEDEHDKETTAITKLDDGSFSIDGRTEIELLNSKLRLNIPEDDEYQTLAGYIMSIAGRIPDINESFTTNDITYKITKKSANRLEQINVSFKNKPDATEQSDASSAES